MLSRIKILLAIQAMLLMSRVLFAQPDHIVFENYTLENGLPNNTIQQAFQDSRGYMWFATNHGVCRYDGYKFTSFRNDPKDSSSLSGLLARVIYEDSKGTLWIGTESGGLNRFDREHETFEHVQASDLVSGIGNSVKAIVEDKAGRLWLGTHVGLKLYDPSTGKVEAFPFIDTNNPNSPSDSYIRELQFDKQGKLWVGTSAGVDVFDPATRKFIRIYANYPDLKDEIWEIYLDPDGMLWVGTYNNGVFLINPLDRQIKKVELSGDKSHSQTIRSVVRDEDGLYWIGSRTGLHVYNPAKRVSTWFKNVEDDQRSLVNNSVLDVYTDAGKNLWITTRAGISLVIPERQIFKHYNALRNNNQHLNDNEVYAAYADPSGNTIWIGTDKGGVNILNRQTGQFTYLMHDPNNNNSISGNCIKSFLNDGNGNIWIGTSLRGISVFNEKTKKFTHFLHDETNPESLADNNAWDIHKDKKGNIWIASDVGVDRYDEATSTFIHEPLQGKKQHVSWIGEDSDGNLWLGMVSTVAVFKPGVGVISTFTEEGSCFYEDTKGRRWLATRDNGLVLLDNRQKPSKYYDERTGLPNNQVFEILEDKSGRLWLTTANGLTMFDPEGETFTNFDKRDGLQNNQFHYGAAFKLANGELIFGGVNGFNLFNPLKVVKNNYAPPVVLTDLKIFNKSVHINDEFSVLQRCISETKEITIPYDYNILTFEFAALNFERPEKNLYQFKLTGFDKEWNEPGALRSATYTNLDPGTYTFSVVASNNDKVWNEEGIHVRIAILPPFWKTWWFYLLLAVAALGMIHVVITFIVNREVIKQQLDMERVKVKQLNEVNAIKLRFFTNVSHEIRTPLTLIIGPLERMRNTSMSAEAMQSQIEIMYRNANALLKLVNQLLDFRKLETGNLKLELSNGDLVFFIREIVHSFQSMAEDKSIQLKFSSFNETLITCFDADKVEKIMNNLLSNAFKFTPKNGMISIFVTLGVDDSFDSNNEFIDIVVKDNGIGIAPENRDRIFHRFFQVSENKSQGGTGIGLALTKELVKLHKGEIFVDSKPDKGTRFTVRLPLIKEQPDLKSLPTEGEEQAAPRIEKERQDLLSENILLIIEDNADVRQFIRSNFEAQFHVEEAVDGSEGIRLAKKLLPDIILSDVMMPLVDGNQLCKKLKADEQTSHIPIILLTALSSKEHIIEGLSSGADDYITKPFDISILQTKIENLLSLRDSLRKKFTGELVLSPMNVTVNSPDEVFLRRAAEVVEKNISDPELDIETFAHEIGVSRMQMYRKLSALTGMTVKEFIRDIRLKRAAQLLDQKKLNVSEVAYAVGFKDLSHFRKCFREKYGMNATEYVKKNGDVAA